MSDRIEKSWIVLRSIECAVGDYCVDIFSRPDGSYVFEEFRKDPEDMGKWTGVKYYSALSFSTEAEALEEAKTRVSWLPIECN